MPQRLPVYTVADIRAIEQAAAPAAQPTLMARAGAAAARHAERLLAQRPGGVIWIAAGPGNNGGDGFVLASLLARSGHTVRVAFLGDAARLPADAAAAYQAWHAAGGGCSDALPDDTPALIIDALFGIGLSRPLEGHAAEWVAQINAISAPCLALDVPSGLCADTGRILGAAVQASHTLTFIGLKPGLLTLDGPDCCGEIAVDSLDLPAPQHPGGRVILVEDFAGLLRARRRNSHKGDWGEVGVVGGAPGMVGAAWLTGRAALRTGAGRVYVGCVDERAPALDPIAPELMMRSADDATARASVIAIGPGLGRSTTARRLIGEALSFHGPLVLDADALNLIAADAALQDILAARRPAACITPHPAEAARLLHTDTASVQSNRLAAARALADRYQAHTLLKGCGTIVAHPDGRWAINRSGHPGLATAGTGDVLTGIIASLAAQGWPLDCACEAAALLHGEAADWLADQGIGPVGCGAGELPEAARAVLNRWIRDTLPRNS